MTENEFIPYVISKNGNLAQLSKAVEELLECATLLQQYVNDGRFNHEHIAEEIADSYLMLDQACVIFGIPEMEIGGRIQYKIKRYLQNEKEGKKVARNVHRSSDTL